MADLEALKESLSGLSLKVAAELVKILVEEWGVSAAAPVAMAGGPAAGGGADAEAVRLHLLDRDGIGVISVGSKDVRVAFSCLELDEVQPLFEALHRAIQEVATRA